MTQSTETKKPVDLFETPKLIPKGVQKVFWKMYDKRGGYVNFRDLEKMWRQVRELGYTFDYSDNKQPFALRKKSVRIWELEGYDFLTPDWERIIDYLLYHTDTYEQKAEREGAKISDFYEEVRDEVMGMTEFELSQIWSAMMPNVNEQTR